eukprot:scaffold1799_cov225-Pinguiococcus_pyrenoidosus.AAC.3
MSVTPSHTDVALTPPANSTLSPTPCAPSKSKPGRWISIESPTKRSKEAADARDHARGVQSRNSGHRVEQSVCRAVGFVSSEAEPASVSGREPRGVDLNEGRDTVRENNASCNASADGIAEPERDLVRTLNRVYCLAIVSRDAARGGADKGHAWKMHQNFVPDANCSRELEGDGQTDVDLCLRWRNRCAAGKEARRRRHGLDRRQAGAERRAPVHQLWRRHGEPVRSEAGSQDLRRGDDPGGLGNSEANDASQGHGPQRKGHHRSGRVPAPTGRGTANRKGRHGTARGPPWQCQRQDRARGQVRRRVRDEQRRHHRRTWKGHVNRKFRRTHPDAFHELHLRRQHWTSPEAGHCHGRGAVSTRDAGQPNSQAVRRRNGHPERDFRVNSHQRGYRQSRGRIKPGDTDGSPADRVHDTGNVGALDRVEDDLNSIRSRHRAEKLKINDYRGDPVDDALAEGDGGPLQRADAFHLRCD